MPGKTLELGCGTGRVLLRLAKEHLRIVGLDNDPAMLQFIRQSIPPTISHLIEIHSADMRDFDLGESFPLIILPCNTLSTFDSQDRTRIFRSVRKHLSPDGVFAFSVPNGLVLKDLPAVGEEELEDEFAHPATNNHVNVYSSWQRDADSISFYWRYEHVFPDSHSIKAEHSTTHFLDPPQTYVSELSSTGLKPITAYGDFYHAKFEPDSPYFVVMARPV